MTRLNVELLVLNFYWFCSLVVIN